MRELTPEARSWSSTPPYAMSGVNEWQSRTWWQSSLGSTLEGSWFLRSCPGNFLISRDTFSMNDFVCSTPSISLSPAPKSLLVSHFPGHLLTNLRVTGRPLGCQRKALISKAEYLVPSPTWINHCRSLSLEFSRWEKWCWPHRLLGAGQGYGARAPHWNDFSCGAQALGHVGSVVAVVLLVISGSLPHHALQLRQASLSFTISQSLLKLLSIESVMLSNHLILCHPHLLLPSIFLDQGSSPVLCIGRQTSNLWTTVKSSNSCWFCLFDVSPHQPLLFPFHSFSLVWAHHLSSIWFQWPPPWPPCPYLILSWEPSPTLASIKCQITSSPFSKPCTSSCLPPRWRWAAPLVLQSFLIKPLLWPPHAPSLISLLFLEPPVPPAFCLCQSLPPKFPPFFPCLLQGRHTPCNKTRTAERETARHTCSMQAFWYDNDPTFAINLWKWPLLL